MFPDGTLTIKHQVSTSRQTFDSRTCVFTSSETGTYTIIRGTGAYEFAFELLAVLQHNEHDPAGLGEATRHRSPTRTVATRYDETAGFAVSLCRRNPSGGVRVVTLSPRPGSATPTT